MWDGLWQCGGGGVCGVEICGSLYNIGKGHMISVGWGI